jgi:hypothetical protein
MTEHKTFKRRVRSRMAKTGESYTAARRMLIDEPREPAPAPPEPAREPDQEPVAQATGRSADSWFERLDQWGAGQRTHSEIARWLAEQPGVGSWWAQSITVSYEQARGRRERYQRPDGFTVTASITIAVPVAELFKAFTDEPLRERWLPGAPLRLRTATAPRSARYDWADGVTRVNVGFTAGATDKSRVALSHERLPDAAMAADRKRWWRERLVELRPLLETGPPADA